jgi:uncharacterized membrane protein YkvA (DUF1232 family)
LNGWARELRRGVLVLWLAARDKRTPAVAKWLCALVAAYAFSPIDLIPDFIPVLGLLDEAILLPLAIALAVRLIPPPLLAEFRAEADRRSDRPVSRLGAIAIVFLWVAAATLTGGWAWRRYG